MAVDKNERWWRQQARLTALKVNAGWFLRWWLPLAVGAGAAFGCAVMLAKRNGMETDGWWLWLLLPLVISAAYAGWRLRNEFYGEADGLVRLEGELRLHNALSSAAAGVGRWPAPAGSRRDGLRWRFDRILAPIAAVAILLAVAWRMPTALPDAVISADAVPPLAWQQVEDALDQLKENETITPDSLESFQEKLESLREQPKEEWYEHASLEAGDELRDQLERNIREFSDGLQLASQTVAEMGASSKETVAISERELQRLNSALEKALQQMASGGLSLDEKFASQLKDLQNMDGAKLANLSPQQMQQLKEALKKAAGQCAGASCQGGGINPGDGPPGEGEGQGNSMTGLPGRGGITRGPGEAPLFYGDEADRASDRTETAASQDFSKAGLGDNIGQSKGEHNVDRTVSTTPESGGAATVGAGGETVWKANLAPAERNALKEFFK